MATTWTKQKLGDLAEIVMGQSPESKYYNETGDGLPFFQGVKDFGFKYPSITKWTTSANKVADEDDILFSVRAPVGDINVAKVKCALGRGVCGIKSKNNQNDFLYFLLLANAKKIINIGNGAIYNSINKPALEKVELMVPEVAVRTRIASILSAYDDLIENNEKRIKALEEMAQLLYTEWFVKFKFPGHEKVKMVESGTEFGKIPEGWKIQKVGDFSGLVSRGPSLKYVEQDGIPVVNQRCIRKGLINWEAVQYAKPLSEQNKDMYLSMYDCLINSMGVGTLGRVSRNVNIHEKAIIHNCITLVRAKNPNIESAFLYYFIKKQEDYFVSSGVGATGQTSLKPEIVANLNILIPQRAFLEKFSSKVMPMWDEIGLLLRNKDVLQQIRDLLIPQLVTGKREIK